MIFQEIRATIAKNPYIFVIFQGGSGPCVPLSGSAHAILYYVLSQAHIQCIPFIIHLVITDLDITWSYCGSQFFLLRRKFKISEILN